MRYSGSCDRLGAYMNGISLSCPLGPSGGGLAPPALHGGFIRIFENRCPPRLTPGPPRGASSSRPPAPPCGTLHNGARPRLNSQCPLGAPARGAGRRKLVAGSQGPAAIYFFIFLFFAAADVVWSSCSFHPRRQVHTPPPPSPFTPRPHPVNHRVSCPVIRMYWTQGETLTDDNKRVEHHALDTARYAAQGGQ